MHDISRCLQQTSCYLKLSVIYMGNKVSVLLIFNIILICCLHS